MTDIVERLRTSASQAGYPKHYIYDEAADEIERLREKVHFPSSEAAPDRLLSSMTSMMAQAADEIERLRAALLTAQAMLSEMGIPSAEKCQMAYDFLHEARAALGENNHD